MSSATAAGARSRPEGIHRGVGWRNPRWRCVSWAGGLSVLRLIVHLWPTVPEQLGKDHLYVYYSCALNLLLYASDPGPQAITVGGPGE